MIDEMASSQSVCDVTKKRNKKRIIGRTLLDNGHVEKNKKQHEWK